MICENTVMPSWGASQQQGEMTFEGRQMLITGWYSIKWTFGIAIYLSLKAGDCLVEMAV